MLSTNDAVFVTVYVCRGDSIDGLMCVLRNCLIQNLT
jgi:hypothetical protein